MKFNKPSGSKSVSEKQPSTGMSEYGSDGKSNIKDLLQKQVCHEFDNERLYFAMALWADYNGYTQLAKFYNKHKQEERRHGMDFVNHMLGRHMKVMPPCEHEQPENFEDIGDVIKQSIKREIETTEMIGELYAEALKTNDMALTIASKYLSEQHEEEQLFVSLYNLWKKCNGNIIDFEMEVGQLKETGKYKIGNFGVH